MYSLTETGIHNLFPVEPTQPQLRIRCRCNRTLIQEQIFTCLACAEYACQYCTTPDFSSYQCRSCKKIYENPKNNKCSSCFSCPFCQSVLTITTDTITRQFITLCQFCYWNSKEVGLKEDTADALIESTNKQAINMKESETKIYNFVWAFFKETNLSIQMENQAFKHMTTAKKHFKRSYVDDTSLSGKQQIQKLERNTSNIIKRTGIDEDSQQFNSNEGKFPQGLALLTRKTRRCPNCTKPLTNLYRPARSNQLKVEIMYKEFKVLQVQRLPPVGNAVKIRFFRAGVFKGKQYQQGEIETVNIGKPFAVSIVVDNKTRGTTTNVTYNFVVEMPEVKKL